VSSQRSRAPSWWEPSTQLVGVGTPLLVGVGGRECRQLGYTGEARWYSKQTAEVMRQSAEETRGPQSAKRARTGGAKSPDKFLPRGIR
jgi:hypothetical protein